jgi:hypothetical protein
MSRLELSFGGGVLAGLRLRTGDSVGPDTFRVRIFDFTLSYWWDQLNLI